MWTIIDKFLNQIAEAQDHDRDDLSLIADLCGDGGPTVFPDPDDRDHIINSVTAGPDVTMPNGWYDDIGSNHIDYRVVLTTGSTKTQIPTTIYSFQHHPLAGCCRFGLNRWVRSAEEWSIELRRQGLDFRKAVANVHGCRTLFVTSGPSGSGLTGELYEDFEMIHETDTGQAMYSVRVA